MIKKSGPSIKTWDGQWQMYNSAPYFKPNRKVLAVIEDLFDHKLKNKKILELGAGSGSDVIYLANLGAETYGLDFSSQSLQSIKYWAKVKKVKVATIQGDITKLKLRYKNFDLIYSVGLMEHFEKPEKLISEQLKLLKTGGYLLIDVPQKYTLYTLAKHLRMRLGTHPFGWETEFSVADLTKLAQKLHTKPYLIYGRDSDILDKLSYYLIHLYFTLLVCP